MTVSKDLVLYGLTAVAEDADTAQNFSSHVWKTKIDLAILGIPYESVNLTFPGIRGDLAKQTDNDKVTVPTIVDGGKTITDSWVIAEYLEEQYAKPAGKSLFGGSEAGKSFAKFIEGWANNTLAGDLRPLILPKLYTTLDAPSSSYFLAHKLFCDASKAQTLLDRLSDTSFVSTQTASARAKLQVLESVLSYNASQSNGPFIGGKEPGHVDACVWGWYAFSRVNRQGTREIWENKELPRVGEWVTAIFDAGLAKEKDLFEAS